ncbi:hypothetical protein [Pseudofrankia asymbiotica]|uniref:Uncharacterized protein n=1 Tax=Pseudofrankia asymbiotica TaxID=1834516 RepID=A0A1V2I1A5_9ACTN|nr:hypothetical protein [Pseudofrankia asymbiotica]ONH23547.1 hypothetical protein BL253_32660 [Pseudofrankia asymbiotica]
MSQAERVAATPKPSTLPAEAAAASSFVVPPVNATPAGALPIAAPAPGTDPTSAPSAPYTPARATDPVRPYTAMPVSDGVPLGPGQQPLATAGAPDLPQPFGTNTCDVHCWLAMHSGGGGFGGVGDFLGGPFGDLLGDAALTAAGHVPGAGSRRA